MSLRKILRIGIATFFVLIVYAGVFRKWLMPGYSQLFYVLKDIVLASTFGLYLSKQGLRIPKGLRGSALGALLMMFFFYCSLQVFNPALPSVLLGIWGFKSHLLYASLLFLIPAAFVSFSQLKNYLFGYLLLSLPVLVLCVVQFSLPVDHFLNVYARSEHVNFLPGIKAPRVTGTFASNAGMGAYSFLASYLAFLFLLMERGGMSRYSIPAYFILPLSWIVMFMTGGRWPFFAWAAALGVWGLSAVVILPIGRYLSVFLQPRWILSILLVVGLGYYVTSIYGEAAVDTTVERMTETTGGTSRRLRERLFQPYYYVDDAGVFGYGVGATYQAAQILTSAPKFSWLASHLKIEEALEREMLELGVLGFSLLMLVLLSLYYLGFQSVNLIHPYEGQTLCLGAVAFTVVCWAEQIVYHPYTSAFFWGFAGIVICLRSWALACEGRLPTG